MLYVNHLLSGHLLFYSFTFIDFHYISSMYIDNIVIACDRCLCGLIFNMTIAAKSVRRDHIWIDVQPLPLVLLQCAGVADDLVGAQ